MAIFEMGGNLCTRAAFFSNSQRAPLNSMQGHETEMQKKTTHCKSWGKPRVCCCVLIYLVLVDPMFPFLAKAGAKRLVGSRLASRREPTFHVQGNLFLLLFLESVCEEFSIVCSFLLGLFRGPFFQRDPVSLSLESNGRDQALNFRGLCRGLLSLLGRELSSNDVFSHIIVLGEVLLCPT